LQSVLLRGVEARRRSAPALRASLDAESLEDEELHLVNMRRTHGREVLAAGLDFLGGHLDVVTAGHRLSTLASAVLEDALVLARRKVAARHGEPDGARFVVCALGRLGGRELGFFADVDIVFLYDAAGSTDGPRPITAPEWAARVAQKLVWAVSAPLVEGRCYEVDTRLRPSGNQGPLVSSLDAFARYHRSESALWERQALLKLRPVAGDADLGRAVLEAAREELARPLPSGFGRQLLEMRGRQIVERTQRDELDIKLGPGGLADIEFAVQGLLLSVGHRAPRLAAPSTRRSLRRLERFGAIGAEEAAILRAGADRLGTAREALTLVDDRRGAGMKPDDERLSLITRAHPALADLLGDSAHEPGALYAALEAQASAVGEVARELLSAL
jgi:glutamate-ammonia-ligase adenylyltransferase